MAGVVGIGLAGGLVGGWADALAGVAPLAAFMASSLVKRPAFPVPEISAGFSPCSSTTRRTAGDRSEVSGAPTGAATGAGVETSGAGAAASGLGVAGEAGAGVAAAPEPSPSVPRSAPTSTVSPSFTITSDKTPADCAGTSMVTLSVSNSQSGSSTATVSPGFLYHCAMVASVMDSPNSGTRISLDIGVSALSI